MGKIFVIYRSFCEDWELVGYCETEQEAQAICDFHNNSMTEQEQEYEKWFKWASVDMCHIQKPDTFMPGYDYTFSVWDDDKGGYHFGEAFTSSLSCLKHDHEIRYYAKSECWEITVWLPKDGNKEKALKIAQDFFYQWLAQQEQRA